MAILVTGVAGFIGYHVAKRLLSEGENVIGIDNINDYYDINLKQHRLARLQANAKFDFYLIDLTDPIPDIITSTPITHIIHLAAQAGVRYSMTNPGAFTQSNLVGFQNLIHAAKDWQVQNFVYASSSSVYGHEPTPWHEGMSCDSPASLYAATKRCNEIVAASYSTAHRLPTTGLRFFTVYGPLGRPDMFLRHAIKSAAAGEPIKIFCPEGEDMTRNFTYIDDIVDGILAAMHKPQLNEIYNLASREVVSVVQAAKMINYACGGLSKIEYVGYQPGDLLCTEANTEKAQRELGFNPKWKFEDGLAMMIREAIGHRRGPLPGESC